MSMLSPEHRTSRRRALGCLLAALVAVSITRPAAAAAAKVGDPFPSLSEGGLEGTVPELQGKVVLVDFWASWCGPCKKSFPAMKELQDKFGPRGFTILAISVDEKKAAMDAFLKKNNPGFAIVRDARGRLPELLGVETMPTSFLLDPSGKILARHSGYEGESTKREYAVEIEAALKAAGK